MKKIALAGLLALILAPVAAMAQIIVRVAPPAPIVEVHDHPPHPGWVWNDGYHRWDGHRYVWVRGHYDRRPHARARWEGAHWEARGRGHVWVEGRWR